MRTFLEHVKKTCIRDGMAHWFEHPEVLSASAAGKNHASSRASDIRNAGYYQMLGFNAEWVRDSQDPKVGKLFVQYTGLWHGRPDKCPARMHIAPPGRKYKGVPTPTVKAAKAA
jgi:hypothetical protein